MSETLNVSKLIEEAAARVVAAGAFRGITLATVESCTAGRLVVALTDVPEAGETVDGGFVTYTKEQKTRLGVPPDIILRDGVVSESVARSMAEAGLKNSPADIAVSLTGVAGPTTDDENNPIGLLFIAVAQTGAPTRVARRDYGQVERDVFMNRALSDALALLYEVITDAK